MASLISRNQPRPGDGANPIDRHVGLRIRLRRKELGISQGRLAEALGLTFQQVQKYERGGNRVSASKLWEAARVLNVSPSYFFEGLEKPGPDGDPDVLGELTLAQREFLLTPEGVELAALFPKVRRQVRRKVFELLRAMAAEASSMAEHEVDASA